MNRIIKLVLKKTRKPVNAQVNVYDIHYTG